MEHEGGSLLRTVKLFCLGLDTAIADCHEHRGMVVFILIGVNEAEIGQGIFEDSALAHVAGQNDRIGRTGMRPRQDPSAQTGIVF